MSRMLTIQQAAERLGLPVSTLRTWRQSGAGPRAGKLGRRLFYREEDLDAWVDEQFAADAAAAG